MNKKRLLWILALLAVVAFIYLKPDEKESAKTIETPAATGDFEINILSVNDMHANIDLFPKFAALVDSLRELYPDLLIFSAGDNRTGNPVNDQYEPVNYPVITLMNKVGFNLSAVGNHEWDGNIVNLQNDIKRAKFPFLCANVFIRDSIHLDIKPFEVLEHKGIKLAVVGMIEIRHDGIPGAHPDNLKKVSFKSAMEVLPNYQYLKNESNAFILLSHCGIEDDMELAQAYPWIDVIIGGHSHTLIDPPTEQNGVIVTQSGSSLNYATLLTLRFKEGKMVEKEATVLDVNNFRHENAEVKAMVEGYNNNPALNESIGVAKTRFNNKEEIGCMMTDALREISGADFAFQNTGGVRVKYLDKGPITIKDVYCIDPFNNDVVVYEMTGAQVKHFILNSFRKNGGYPSHVSGMTYTVGDDGHSVWIKTPNAPFSTQKRYKVAFNSYMASTIDVKSVDEGRSMFKTSEEMIIEFLKKHKEVDYQGVSRTR